MIPDWIKKYWKDDAFRAFTVAFIVFPILCDALICFIDQEFKVVSIPVFWSLLVVMYVIAYFKRNSK